MTCAANPARPTSITCTCGCVVPVKPHGPIPVMCSTCAEARQRARELAWQRRHKEDGGPFVEQLGALEGAEELKDGRKRLGCELAHLRARVEALARDWGLPAPTRSPLA
ncbi:hypothetical protein [Vitiosangium sp. GDMCC 1.1324]|uniref:hypothetical protein n=1 Tax=Vitiosangium sp. (strain GDMCC 1.1324) TaxID=2138576 RepID=UPI000D35607F|nr:hypothetical protein [Vitiosangium sp. GDMCC 1.1324]PTL79082.1 hypothetical protein DAT35_36345 [Vitiosangium sp. GDMCC 1.1324]